MELNFKNKTVLVTGGTRGIGKAIANKFKKQGANVIITGTKKGDVEGFEYMQVDFSYKDSFASFIMKIQKKKIDVCVNNAGINIIKPLDEITFLDYNEIESINLRAPFFLSQAVAEIMKKNSGGKIINIASIWGIVSKSKRSLYSTMKSGLIGMTRAMAIELAPYNISVNSISPGFTNTELTNNSLSEDEKNTLKKDIPIGRFAEPAEIADIVLNMASDSNNYITGQNIIIDGGFTSA